MAPIQVKLPARSRCRAVSTLTLAIVVCELALPTLARGGDQSAQGQPSSDQLQEIVVTAQKREERLQDVPISVSVLSGPTLDASTSQGLFDELNRVPGVYIPPPGGYSGLGLTQIAIRGVASSGVQWSGSSPVAYYLDTVPFGFVRSAFIPDSSAFDLARVEVLRGPQGTLYGANAEDGVVRVIPNEADPNGFDLKARLLGSSTDGGGVNGGGDLAVNVPLIAGQLAIRGVVGYEDWSGWIDRPSDNDANDAQLRNYRLKLAYQPIDGLVIDLSYWGSRDHYGSQPTSFPDRTAPYGVAPQPIDNDFDTYAAKVSYQFTHFSLSSMTSYLDFTGYNAWDGTYLFGAAAFGGPPVLANWMDSHVFSEELLLNSTDTAPWHWTAGAFYRNARDDNAQGLGVGAAPTSPDPSEIAYVDFKDSSRSYAAFGEVGRRILGDKLEWTLGLRQFHDDVASTSLDPLAPSYVPESFNATTPRAVLSWYPSTNITAYSSFSEGFRSGIPQYYTITAVLPGIQPARPDKLYNYEIGAKGDFLDHRLALDVTGYYVKWKDVQQTIGVPYQGGFLNAVLNGPSASGPGIDFAITVRPLDHVQVGATLSWNGLTMDGPVEQSGLTLFNRGDRLNNSSDLTGSFFGSYSLSLGGASGEFSLSANYLSKQATYGISGANLAYVNYGDNVFFMQAAFTVTFSRGWAVKLYGDNLTNEYGSVVGPSVGFDPTSEDQGITRPRPRTVGFEIDYRFK